jgi:hypothetical protein
MFRKKPKPLRRLVTAPLNDAEYAALKAEVIRRHNELPGHSIEELKADLAELEQARETPRERVP